MEDLAVVHVLHAKDNLDEPVKHGGLGEELTILSFENLFEVTSGAEVHEDAELGLALEVLVRAHDIGMM